MDPTCYDHCVVQVRGVGAYLPQKIITNDDLPATLDTNDEWIRTRTGIHQRHLVADHEKTSDMAIQAAQRALDDAGVKAADIDLVILATTTADHIFPATATKVQQVLGTKGFAFDLAAACSGFLFALPTAESYLKAGLATRALVIGADTMSRLLDWTDRTTAVLFGDGAGAFVLEREGADSVSDKAEQSSGFLGHLLKTDGKGYDALYVKGGVGCGHLGCIAMEGREVFKHAVQGLTAVSQEILQRYGLTPDDVDKIVPHQANRRIIESVMKRLEMPLDKVHLTMDKHANTSAASIPLAFADGLEKGLIKRGQTILFQAFAAGFAWGASLLRF